MDNKERILANRKFMHCPKFAEVMSQSDQQKGIKHPAHGHPITGERIVLPFSESAISEASYPRLLDIRRSERKYKDEAITQEQLAFLLWSAQGIQQYRGDANQSTLRPAPSGGARHPFELYFVVRKVVGLKPGLYRYAPVENVGEKIVTVEYKGAFENHEERISSCLANQVWASTASVVLFFTSVAYRAEWRYVEASHRVVLIDLGHAGQNVMLSASALGLGSCCIAAYNQQLCDEALSVNGVDEYTVYIIPVGIVN